MVEGLKANESTSFHQVKALPGDGIYSLLRRYQLDQFSCNFTKFYELNKLKRNARLIVGRDYQLPILIYTFNGKTIRSSIGVNDWDLAVTIQTYNEEMLTAQLRETSFKTNKVLWVPYHLLNCRDKQLDIASPVENNPEEGPGKAGNRNFPIFGKDYAYTPLRSNKLKGKVFYVVGGHGGPDPGAMGRRGDYVLCEDEYAYDVALRLCRNLIAHGATAYMITRDPDDGIRSDKYLKCDTDEVLWGGTKMSYSQKTRLFQRSDIINELYEKHRLQGVVEQTMIVIHVDSRSKKERTDLFFYHFPGNSEGQTIAAALHKKMKQKYKQYRKGGFYHGTVSGRDLHMLRECKPRAVYIELANIRNTFDQQRIILEKNRQLIADWLFEALD
ncbi:MAG: hypothetical protein DHS20C18_40960 [Saprospiraceae bacterium]|nr:MAG: hypothetical protein DHS20C18_40960 [Saprospiraceae bacterium]